eukprot:s397_g13.t1
MQKAMLPMQMFHGRARRARKASCRRSLPMHVFAHVQFTRHSGSHTGTDVALCEQHPRSAWPRGNRLLNPISIRHPPPAPRIVECCGKRYLVKNFFPVPPMSVGEPDPVSALYHLRPWRLRHQAHLRQSRQ